jgi:hypothetical protein
MNVAEWILVAILSSTLAIFLIVSIVFVCGLIKLTKEIRNVVIKGGDIVDDVSGITHNVKKMTNVSGLIKTVLDTFNIRVGKKK